MIAVSFDRRSRGLSLSTRRVAQDRAVPGAQGDPARPSPTSIWASPQRLPAQTALAGRPVMIRVAVRRFRCGNPTCTRKIFAERLENVAARGIPPETITTEPT